MWREISAAASRGAAADVCASSVEACFELIVDAFLAEWGAAAVRAAKARPIAERDGWRCSLPTCSARDTLKSHHIAFRSHGGDDTPAYHTLLCHGHHHHGVHEGHVDIKGTAPNDLRIALGVRRGDLPHQVYVGRRRVHPES